MRNGRLLTEDTPKALMERYNTNVLEEIVIELCLKDTPEEDPEPSGGEPNGPKLKVSLFPAAPRSQGIILSASALSPTGHDGPQAEPLRVPGIGRWPSLGEVLHKAAAIPAMTETLQTKSKYKKKAGEKSERVFALLVKNTLVLARNLMWGDFH